MPLEISGSISTTIDVLNAENGFRKRSFQVEQCRAFDA